MVLRKVIEAYNLWSMKKAMLTATEFAEAIGVPYPTVALWLRKGKIQGAEQLELGSLKVWQIPAMLVKSYKDEKGRPKRGRPKKEEKQSELGASKKRKPK